MLGPKHTALGPETLIHDMKYKELFFTLPRPQPWHSQDSGCPPAWSLLARELEHSKEPLGTQKAEGGPVTRQRTCTGGVTGLMSQQSVDEQVFCPEY